MTLTRLELLVRAMYSTWMTAFAKIIRGTRRITESKYTMGKVTHPYAYQAHSRLIYSALRGHHLLFSIIFHSIRIQSTVGPTVGSVSLITFAPSQCSWES